MKCPAPPSPALVRYRTSLPPTRSSFAAQPLLLQALVEHARDLPTAGLWPAWTPRLMAERMVRPGEDWFAPCGWYDTTRAYILAEIGLPLPNDRRASAHHAQIFHAPDGLYIRDQSSKNGTYVNGQLVSSARLTDRAVIRIGNTILLFRYKVRASWQGSPLAAAARAQDTLLGSSPEMEELRYQLACAAERTASVLLLGATGTGKELAARALHAQSAGPDAPRCARADAG